MNDSVKTSGAAAGDIREHDDEPVIGLPECLPEGECLLWQGSPDTRALARRVLHVDKVVLWFAVIAAWQLIAHWSKSGELAAGLLLVPALALCLGLSMLYLLAWLYARTTVYTLTNRRVTMRFGIAVQITMNIPFGKIRRADVSAQYRDIGNIAFEIEPGARVSHLVLWPNVKPWHWFSPQPMLCCVNDLSKASSILTDAVCDYSESSQTGLQSSSQTELDAGMQGGIQGA